MPERNSPLIEGNVDALCIVNSKTWQRNSAGRSQRERERERERFFRAYIYMYFIYIYVIYIYIYIYIYDAVLHSVMPADTRTHSKKHSVYQDCNKFTYCILKGSKTNADIQTKWTKTTWNTF